MANWDIRVRSKIFNSMEKAFVAMTLFVATGALLPLFLFQGQEKGNIVESGSLVLQVFWIATYFITFFLVLKRIRPFFNAIKKDIFLMLIVGFTLASVLWSVEPVITLRRSFALLGTTFLGVYMALRYPFKVWLELLAWVLGVIAFLSLFFCLALPQYGIDHSVHEGAWQGVFTQKNILGRLMVLASFLFLAFALNTPSGKRKNYYLLFLTTIVLVIFSTSITSMLTFILSLLLLMPMYFFRKYRKWFWITVATTGLILLILVRVIYFNFAFIIESLGRDITLTGRLPLWLVTLQKASEKYLFGYGYGAFWTGWSGPSSDIWQTVQWEAPHAHNGFLDLFLSIGGIGLALFLLSFISMLISSAKYFFCISSELAIWPLLYCYFVFLANLSESNFLVQNNLFWILYVALSVSINQQKRSTVINRIQNNTPVLY